MTAVPLTDRIAAVIRPRMLIGLQDAELFDAPGTERINEWADSISQWAADSVQPELDRLRDQAETLQLGAIEREALLTEARDVLEAAGQNGAHGDDWPAVAPAIKALAAELEQAQADVERIRTRENGVRTDRRKALRELEQARAELATARAAAFREAARVLEDTGHDDDAVNLLDNIADGITTHAQPTT